MTIAAGSPTSPRLRRLRPSALPALLAALGAVGCGDDAKTGGSSATEVVYATMTNVYSGEDRTVYVALTESLDQEIDFDDAYELGGVGNMEAIGGHMLLSSGESPLITKYEVSPPADWN